jgi:hypothetical protein
MCKLLVVRSFVGSTVLSCYLGLRERVTALRRAGDAGYSTEAVIVVALMVAAAITVVGIIVAKVTTRATNIDLGP